MKLLKEIDWVQSDGAKGALVLADDGLYFQPYEMSKRASCMMGDSLAINRTGVFGAVNMHKKLKNPETPSLPEIAKVIRREKGLKKLIGEGLASFIYWRDVTRIKKRKLMGTVEIIAVNGTKMIIRNPDDKKSVLDIVKTKIK